jgi:hypothetical protein
MLALAIFIPILAVSQPREHGSGRAQVLAVGAP